MKQVFLVVAVTAGLTVGACKSKCVEATPAEVFDSLDASTVAAVARAQTALSAKMCGRTEDEAPTMTASGSLGNSWKAIEDELIKEGWGRAHQSDTPEKPSNAIFTVQYKRDKSPNAPIMFMFATGDHCRLGDVCITGHTY